MDSQPSKRPTLWLMLGNMLCGVLTIAAFVLFNLLSYEIIRIYDVGTSLILPIVLALLWLSYVSWRYYKKMRKRGFSKPTIWRNTIVGTFVYAASAVVTFMLYFSALVFFSFFYFM
ncbi:MAG: hypothetical protein LBC35_05005 [Coriobacteriales bacterium]|jgi:hypothetical protein|nr:hypothetical protein [Coriobacteriales bacterium]